MAIGQFGAVAKQIGRLFGSGTVSGLDESALLRRFVTRQDSAALEALVTRHGPMVLGVCRRVLGNSHEVDDAFQATFLVMVKKAGTISDPSALGPWLFGVAHRVASRARQNAAKKAQRERSGVEEIAMAASIDESSLDRDELRTMIDDEIARLPERFRRPVVLCYLQGLTHDEAASQLRCPVGTVRSRLSTARNTLRDRLSRRGITVPAGAMAATLTAEAATAAIPIVLLDKTITAAMAFAASGMGAAAVGAVSAGAASLAEGVATTMMISKLKAIGAVMIGGALTLGAGGAAAVRYTQDEGGPEPRQKVARKIEKNQEVERRFAEAEITYSEEQLNEVNRRLESLKRQQESLEKMAKKLQASLESQRSILRELDRNENGPSTNRVEIQDRTIGKSETPAGRSGTDAGGEADNLPPTEIPFGVGATAEGVLDGSPVSPKSKTASTKNATAGGESMGGGMMGGGMMAGGMGGRTMGGGLAGGRGMGMSRGGYGVGFQQASATSVGDYVIIQNPERTRMIASNPETSDSAVYEIPAGTKAIPIVGNGIVAFMMEGESIKELPAFVNGKWVKLDLKEPASKSVMPLVGVNSIVYTVGSRVYAFSSKAGTWDVLELGDDDQPQPLVMGNRVVVSTSDQIHIFDVAKGQWSSYQSGVLVDHKGHTYIYNTQADKWTDLGEGSFGGMMGGFGGGMGGGGFR